MVYCLCIALDKYRGGPFIKPAVGQDAIELLSDTMLANDVCKGLIRDSNTEYETPRLRAPELILDIHRFLNLLFLAFLSLKEY